MSTISYSLIRYSLLAAILAGTSYACWINFEQRMDYIFSRNISDEANVFSKDERNSLIRAMTAIKQQFGLELKIDIYLNEIPTIKTSGHAALFSVAIQKRDVEITLPLIAQKAIDKARVATLDANMTACLNNSPPAGCIFNGIHELAEALTP